MRNVYGVIVRLDLQSDVIVTQSSNDNVVLVNGHLIHFGSVHLFGQNAVFGSAIKMFPMAECPFVSSVLVEIDVEGFRV
ncbi:MAG: hypothetical protein ACTS80_00380 [Candidatus Hodgkinia cicadicola]